MLTRPFATVNWASGVDKDGRPVLSPAKEPARDGRLVWAFLTQDMLQQSGATADLDDGLPSYLIDIEGAQIAALFKEHAEGFPRVSLRTVHPYDAAAMAAHFGGGGHVRAAGFTYQGTLADARRDVLAYLEQQLEHAEHGRNF